MRGLQCAIAEQRVVERTRPPLLSIFIPTWRRTAEMVHAVRSIASQITGGLEDKVDIVISDNSEAQTWPETQQAIRELANEFPFISYYFNARNEGAQFQVFAVAPSRLQEFIKGVRETFERASAAGDTPVLLTGPVIRPYVRSIIERFRPQTVVMSQNEVHPKARLKTVGVV